MDTSKPAARLLALRSVRERCSLLSSRIDSNDLIHFHVDLEAFDTQVVPAVVQTIRSYVGTKPFSTIPPHGRWQHFDVGRVHRLDDLIAEWGKQGVDRMEQVRRVIDVTLVSVLLDAGAGNSWKYSEGGQSFARSEGLAVASLHMFTSGLFSSDKSEPCQVDGTGLASLTEEKLAKGLQVSASNHIEGLTGRTQLLKDIGKALKRPEFFGEDGRPGNMLGYLLSYPTSESISKPPVINVEKLWTVLTQGLGEIWPVRTKVDSKGVGDAWHYEGLKKAGQQEWEDIVPFHKLTQWLCYSLLIPLKRMLNAKIEGEELQTGLPEYRNGGLLVDYSALTLKDADRHRGLQNAEEHGVAADDVPWFTPEDDVIIEWRAVTVCMLDMLLPKVNEQLGLRGNDKLSLAQMLEAGSWATGRTVAAKKRPQSKGPPINIISDGTVF